MSIPRILIIPARRHILEAYSEYIIRYLGNEFYFEMGYPSMPEYYSSIKENVWGGKTHPLMKNPDEFDLIYPHFSTHWFLEPPEKYAHKVAIVTMEHGQYSRFPDKVAIIGVTSKFLEIERPDAIPLRFGVDTELFRPFPQARLDDKIHVGFIGNIQTPRRYIKELFMPLKSLEGIKLDIYPTSWLNSRDDEIEAIGGQDTLDNIVGGDVWLSGLPNIYNRMDIYIRCDINLGYQISLLEAAACGVPIVTTDPGVGKEICEAGGGIYVECQENNWQPEVLEELAGRIKKAVISLRNSVNTRRRMSILARTFILDNYAWENHLPNWRKFFQKGLENAKKM